MRENLHTALSACLFFGQFFLLATILLPAPIAAQNCNPDTEPPLITTNHPLLQGLNSGDTLIFECGQQVVFGAADASATDNCDASPSVGFNETLIQGNCLTDGYLFSLHCCWTATDDSGNGSLFCVRVVIEDTEPPALSAAPADLTVDLTMGDTIPAAPVLTANDECFGAFPVIFSEENIPDAVGCGYTLVRTWSTSDDCGNSTALTQNISVVENCPPCPLAFAGFTIQHTTCGEDNGHIKFGLNGVQGPISYAWSPDVSFNNMAHDLAAGNYAIQVEDQSNGCQIDTVITLESSQALNLQVVASPETCAGNDGSILLTPGNGTGLYTFTWSPAVSSGNLAANLNNSQTYSATVTDELGCEISIVDLAVGYDCDTATVMPQPDIFSLIFECGMDSLALCTDFSELAGDFNQMTICQGPANGELHVSNDTCLLYVPNIGFEGDDSCCAVLCDDLGVCDTFFFEILVEDCIGQIPCIVLANDYAAVAIADCEAEAKVCLEHGLGEILLYDFFIDGSPYTGDFDACSFDTIISYGFAAVPGNAMNGPYELTSWEVEGQTFAGMFDDVFEMVDLMNFLDPAGNWSLDTASLSIVSYHASGEYGPMSVFQNSSGNVTTLNLNTATAPTGSSLYLPVGEHEVVLTHQQYAFCTDTLRVDVICMPNDFIFDTIIISQTETACMATGDLPGSLQSAQLVCPNCNDAVFTLTDTCVSYTGFSVGVDTAWVIFCDNLGICDTTGLIVSVLNDGAKPVANADRDTTIIGVDRLLNVLANDEINGTLRDFDVVISPKHGRVKRNADHTFTYSPDDDFCGEDQFMYWICNENDCDTAYVYLKILCERVVIFNGFSPNGDGVNDHFNITNLKWLPGHELQVFNRWGNLVYQARNYQSDWNGYFQNAKLPDGTYFYILDLGNRQVLKGYVQLQR